MASFPAERPLFFEGQYLGADDLNALADYLRVQDSRHNLGLHAWGIAAGLELVEQEALDGGLEVFLQPGYAIDGYGRAIVVLSPYKLSAEDFSNIDVSGPTQIWLRYQEDEFQGVRPGFQVCDSSDNYERIAESFAVEVGRRNNLADRQDGIQFAGELMLDARDVMRNVDDTAPLVCDASVAQQSLPPSDPDALWLIPVGYVGWQIGAPGSFVALSDEQRLLSRSFRRHAGVIAESVYAANGLIRLRDRRTAYVVDKTNDELCATTALKSKDLMICEAQVTSKELVWIEGDVRITGDARLFGSALEFRDENGKDYLNDAGSEQSPALLMRRFSSNSLNGDDLQMLLGKSADGRNRFIVAQTQVSGDACDWQFAVSEKVVIQDNGMVGIGTFNPVSSLALPLTIRGIDDNNELLGFEREDGTRLWQFNLSPSKAAFTIYETSADESRFCIDTGGNVGIATITPQAKLEITDVPTTTNGSPLGTDLWFRIGDGDDGGRVWLEYGSQAAPLLVMSDKDDPARIQFQQTGSGSETAPQFSSWIGHAGQNTANISVYGGYLGVGTTTPYTALSVNGSLGFKNGTDPLVFIFESGTNNSERMLLTHSPSYTDYGLSYRDSDDTMIFYGNGITTLSADLANQRVGIGTNDPADKLDVRGNVKLGSSGNFFALGGVDNFKAVIGEVGVLGGAVKGSGFTAVRVNEGRYVVNFSSAYSGNPIVIASPVNATNDDNCITVNSISSGGFFVAIKDISGDGDYQDTAFSFVAFGTRN